jgi:hypothetical protein
LDFSFSSQKHIAIFGGTQRTSLAQKSRTRNAQKRPTKFDVKTRTKQQDDWIAYVKTELVELFKNMPRPTPPSQENEMIRFVHLLLASISQPSYQLAKSRLKHDDLAQPFTYWAIEILPSIGVLLEVRHQAQQLLDCLLRKIQLLVPAEMLNTDEYVSASLSSTPKMKRKKGTKGA